MKRLLQSIVLLGCSICVVGLAAAVPRTPTRGLLFEHIGPEDASIPPFSVEVGAIDASTRTVILVTLKTFESVFCLVKRAGNAPPRSPRPMGTFRVTSFKDGEPEKAFTIYPEAVLSVITRLRRTFEGRNLQMPEVLVTLETLLTPK